MPHIAIRSRGAAAITLFVLSLACLGLGACGGSSNSSTTNTTPAVASTPPPSTATTPATATATTTTESGPPTAADKRRRQVALRVVKCFQSNGVTLPEPNPKGFITVGSAVGTSQFKVALAKCKPILNEAAGVANKK
jgi:hypothetical protein